MTFNTGWLSEPHTDPVVVDRIETLRKVPAAIRFISFEPLIGSVGSPDLANIHWAIVGGESGPNARPMDPQWVEGILAVCKRQEVAFFFKQWGGRNKKATGRTYRGRTWDEMPGRDGARAQSAAVM